jgi:gliding motility-associated-like protein
MEKQILYTVINIAAAFSLFFLSIKSQAQPPSGCTPGNRIPLATIENSIDSLPLGKTKYLYASNGCPADGYYTITDHVANCPGNNWDTVSGNVSGGRFMLINGSANQGEVYVDTFRNLCGNTYYGVGFDIFNVSLPSSCGGSPIRPRLTFSIESPGGTILGSYYTGDIVEERGTEYNVYFTNPTGSNSVIVRVTDSAPGGCGNNFAMDGIGIGSCAAAVTADIESNMCVGSNSFTTLGSTVTATYHSTSYQWQINNGTDWVDIPGAVGSTYINEADTGTSGLYRLTVADDGNISLMNCRAASNQVTIYPGIPTAKGMATSNSPVCENSTINLSASGGKIYQWTGPASFTSADANPSVKATNTSAGQYTVVINDANGCSTSAATTVITMPAPTVEVSNTQSICIGDSVALQASGGDTYSWFPTNGLSSSAIADPIAKPDTATTYIVSTTNSYNCTGTASVLVVVNSKPIVSAGEDKATFKGQSVKLDGSIKSNSGNVDFSWLTSSSLNDIHVLDPVADPIINTSYVLTATAGNGCGVSSDTVLVKVFNGIQVPTAFTPNGDGHNDVWHIAALEAFPNAVVSVYNRYGQKIFESSAGNKDWDGKYKNTAQRSGAYTYVIDLKNDIPVIAGMVVLIR